MKTRELIITMLVVSFMYVHPVLAEDTESAGGPWERFGANLGVFVSALDSSVRIGSGVGVDLDVEKLLGLDSDNSVFRVDALWRFSDNRRHRFDVSWFSFRRHGTRTVGEDITIEDPDGNEITINAGSQVSAFFNLDIYQAAYSYSFFQDDRADLAFQAGAYIMPMDFGIKVSGLVDEEGAQKFTAPLPVLGLRMDFAITPKWFVRTGTQVFYIEYEQFTGSLLSIKGALEYVPFKHFGMGLGFDTFAMELEADGQDWVEIDLRGNVRFKYTGIQLYLRYFF